MSVRAAAARLTNAHTEALSRRPTRSHTAAHHMLRAPTCAFRVIANPMGNGPGAWSDAGTTTSRHAARECP
eukprot:3419279-Prymnesium_polylepis.1